MITKTVQHCYVIPVSLAKERLTMFQRGMLFDMTEIGMSREAIANLLVEVVTDLDAAAEKYGVTWISTPTNPREWAECIEAFPMVFFSEKELEQIKTFLEESNTIVEVRLENGYKIDVKTLISNY